MTSFVAETEAPSIVIAAPVTFTVEIPQNSVTVDFTDGPGLMVAVNDTLGQGDLAMGAIELTSELTLTCPNEALEVIEIGIQGPQGIPGILEEEMVYAKRVDFISDSIVYRGEATPGSTDIEPVWRIHKLTMGTDGDMVETWANGSSKFDQIWSNRLSLTYL